MRSTPFRRAAALSGAAAIAAAAGLAVSTPAFADVDYVYTFVADSEIEELRFATASSSDASLEYLPEESEFFYATGIEQVDGQGYAVGDSPDGWQVATWNVETGEVETAVDVDASDPVFNPPDTVVELNEFYALDSAPDGTLLAFAGFSLEPIIFSEPVETDEIRAQDIGWEGSIDAAYLVSVDPATGVLAPVAELTDYVFDNEFWLDGIATDPISGETYIFADDFADPVGATAAFASTVDLETGDVGAPVQLGGYDAFELGYPGDADFDVDGDLWAWSFLQGGIDEPSMQFLLTLPAPFDPATTEATPVGVVEPDLVELFAIATPEEEELELVATGAEAAGPLAAATAAALLGGVLLILGRRRTARS